MSELKAYNVICTDDISADYDVNALGAVDFEAYACDDVDKVIAELKDKVTDCMRIVGYANTLENKIADLQDKVQQKDFFWDGCGFAKRGFKNTIAVAEYVEKLEKELAELREATRWRNFSEEKPDDKQWIFVHVENPSKYGTYIELRRWDVACKFDVEDQELYTKWMPLPKAPEVK